MPDWQQMHALDGLLLASKAGFRQSPMQGHAVTRYANERGVLFFERLSD